MSDITTLCIPKDITAKAKELKINCSKICRDALAKEIARVMAIIKPERKDEC